MKIHTSEKIIFPEIPIKKFIPSLLFFNKNSKLPLELDGLYWKHGATKNAHFDISNPHQIRKFISISLDANDDYNNLDQFYDCLLDSSIIPEEGIAFVFYNVDYESMLESHRNDLFLTLNILQSISIAHQVSSNKVFQIVLMI
jgi:hypothetical protein